MKRILAHRATFVQFMKFGTVGAAGFVVDTVLVYLGIYALGLERITAGYAAYPLTVTFTWFGNRIFTFREASRERVGEQWSKFLIVCLVGLAFNRGTYSLLVTTVPFAYEYPVIALFGGTLVGMFFNFFLSRRLVFK